MNKVLADKFHFTWLEFSGSLGDLGLFIPLVVGMTVTCGLDIGVVLVFAGMMNIVTGWLFRQPIPVQPMKAIAAVVIAEGLLHYEMVAAGILMGIFLVILSCFTGKITRFVPKAVVRGIQLGVGVKLALKGIAWVKGLPFFGLDSVFVAVLVVCLLCIFLRCRQPGLVYVFLSGFLIQYLQFPESFATARITLPYFRLYWPYPDAWAIGLMKGALPQLPLTLLNSVIAVCALSADYFPGRGITPKRMAASVGLMNLLCVPFGAIPMCHGAGGLAAQYRFGARTGGSVIMLGILKIFVGLLFGGVILGLLRSYPMAILGPMLVFAGFELAKASRDIFREPLGLTVCLVTAGFIVGMNTLAGFLAGSLVAGVCHVYSWGRRKIYSV